MAQSGGKKRVVSADKMRVHIDIERTLWDRFKADTTLRGQTLTARLHEILRRESRRLEHIAN